MKNVLLTLALAAVFAVCAVTVHVGPPESGAVVTAMTGGDSTLAAAGSFVIYPLFTLGGGHMHAMQWVTLENGFSSAQSGYLFSSLSSLRVRVFGAASDTSGFTIPAGATQTALPTCDSIYVLNTGGTQTKVTWAVFK